MNRVDGPTRRTASQALGELESVPDLGPLGCREVAEVAVKATLAGGNGRTRSCDVLVLRHWPRGSGGGERAGGIGETGVAPDVGTDEAKEIGGEDEVWGGWEKREGGMLVTRLVGRMAEQDGTVSWKRTLDNA